MRENTREISITVERHDGPDGPRYDWSIVETDGRWEARGPDGGVAGTYGGPLDALRDSGASAFVPGTAIRIRTNGGPRPFDLITALDGWLVDPFASEAETVDWSDSEDLGWVQEHIDSSFEELGFDPLRIIVIDDLLCGVCTAQIPREPEPIRLIVPCEDDGRLRPVFLDSWATVTPDNGYGSAWYGVGVISPGIMATAIDIGDFPPSLQFERISSNHPENLYEGMLSWMSGYISMTPGIEEFELEVDGSTVTAVFPEEGPYAEAEGWLGPTVLRARPLEGS